MATGTIDAPTPQPPERKVDGIICMGGEDWWYHNRGHYDMQMMREFSRELPVLYINSIGTRTPVVREGRMFLTRILRKLRSIRKGRVPVRRNFTVMSALAAPGRIGRTIQKLLMPFQVRRAARSMGITRPLVWVACPPGEIILDRIDPAGVIYQRTDRFEAFPGVNVQEIESANEHLRKRSDLVLYCSRQLFEEDARNCARPLFVDHGVDFERFSSAGEGETNVPEDVRMIPRPRVGFIGGIDAHTFDPELFNEVVRLLPEMQFVMVGGCSLPEDWCPFENVHFLGQKDYESVADYMAACDVLIMPWNDSDWIKACNPVKLKEYLATGRPVVSTPFDELAYWDAEVRVADNPSDFAEAVKAAIHEGPPDGQREKVQRETWQAKARAVKSALAEQGVCW